MIYRVDVTITAPVNDTEHEDRVARAVRSLFPTADLEVTSTGIRAETHDLEHFADRLREQRILDTARSVFIDAKRGDRFAFSVKKQPALHDVVNFAVGSPAELGDIRVEVRVREPDAETYIEHLAPRTDADGKPLE